MKNVSPDLETKVHSSKRDAAVLNNNSTTTTDREPRKPSCTKPTGKPKPTPTAEDKDKMGKPQPQIGSKDFRNEIHLSKCDDLNILRAMRPGCVDRVWDSSDSLKQCLVNALLPRESHSLPANIDLKGFDLNGDSASCCSSTSGGGGGGSGGGGPHGPHRSRCQPKIRCGIGKHRLDRKSSLVDCVHSCSEFGPDGNETVPLIAGGKVSPVDCHENGREPPKDLEEDDVYQRELIQGEGDQACQSCDVTTTCSDPLHHERPDNNDDDEEATALSGKGQGNRHQYWSDEISRTKSQNNSDCKPSTSITTSNVIPGYVCDSYQASKIVGGINASPVKRNPPVDLDTLLETTPLSLAYSPRTKQLHIASIDPTKSDPDSSDGSLTCSDDMTLSPEVTTPVVAEICSGKALESIDETQESDNADIVDNSLTILSDKQERDSGCGYDSPRNTLQRVGTCTSLSRTDASSFSSISSLSTNTDFSISATDDCTNYGLGGEGALAGCARDLDSGEDSVFLDTQHGCIFESGSPGRVYSDKTHIQGAKPKGKGITGFLSRNLFSWKSKDPISPVNSGGPGWRLFVKESPTHSQLLGEGTEISLDSKSDLADLSNVNGTPRPNSSLGNGVGTGGGLLTKGWRTAAPEFPPSSTTALILENRPSNLPAKSVEEEERHRQQYEQMVEAARRKEMKRAKMRKKQIQQQIKHEDLIAQAVRIWNNEILPNWDVMKGVRKAKDLWWLGIPPSVRGKVWKLAVGNELHITSELYEICVNRARDRIRMASESVSISEEEPEESSADKEGSVELIKLDVSRTFPQLCIFQKGGPYYDLLHSLLGAYVCYRPDVGYVQGMSFLAAVLILNLDVADAFVCFANLLNKPCQLAFFRLDESMMKSYFTTYEEFFMANLPKLFLHFQRQNLTPDLYLIDWIYTLYSKSLPLDVASRVWDVFFRDGEEFLFRTALGILHMYRDILLHLEFIHLAQFLTRLPEDIPAEPLFRSIEMIHMMVDKRRFTQILSSHSSSSNSENHDP